MNAGAKNSWQKIWKGKPGGPAANRVSPGQHGGSFGTPQLYPETGDSIELWELQNLRQKKADMLEWLKPMIAGNPEAEAAARELMQQYDDIGEEIISLGTAMRVRKEMKADEAKRQAP
jgi:hypothetical protein